MRVRVTLLTAIAVGLAGCAGSPKRDPNKPAPAEIYVQKGVQYMENGQLDVALKDLQHALELDSKSVAAHNAIAVLYERLERPQEATKHYEQAISLDPGNDRTLNNYGRFLCAQGQYDKAMGYFGRVVESKLYALPWVALTNAGLCARASGKDAEGEAFLRKALDANPAFGPALLEMAKLSLQSRQYLSARAFLQRYEAAGDLGADGLWLGIQTESALGNAGAASDYLNTLRSRFPDSREALQARRLQLN